PSEGRSRLSHRGGRSPSPRGTARPLWRRRWRARSRRARLCGRHAARDVRRAVRPEDLFAMAGADAFRVAQNQPFVDGNKRRGLAAALVFLDLNGVRIADPDGRLYQAIIDLAEKRLDKGGLADLLPTLATTKD